VTDAAFWLPALFFAAVAYVALLWALVKAIRLVARPLAPLIAMWWA
jgi:hypothetical protein